MYGSTMWVMYYIYPHGKVVEAYTGPMYSSTVWVMYIGKFTLECEARSEAGVHTSISTEKICDYSITLYSVH